MSLSLLALLLANPQSATGEAPLRMRMCAETGRASVQLAYKPYDNAVFGSDGVTCRTVKADELYEPRTRSKVRAQETQDKGKDKPR